MTPLPAPPPSARPPMPQQRRKTSLRTVPKQVQEQFRQRLQELRKDPLRVLPRCEGPEPKALAKVRGGLEKVGAGKAGFLMRRDRGIVGAVVASVDLAEKPIPNRMLDAKVGGQRRFFTVRGNIQRDCMLGVQNHDHPPSLLMAYRPLAKSAGLHFFATPDLVCTGDRPRPPAAWVEALADRAGIALQPADGDWSCGHPGGQVTLRFRGGPDLLVCPACGREAGNLHRLVSARYAGPRQRQPLDILVRAPDGQEREVSRELLAEYRGGVKGEADIVRAALAEWTPEGKVWMLAGVVHPTLEAWLDAMEPQEWEVDALRQMAAEGYKGQGSSVADVLEDLADRIGDGIAAILGSRDAAFVAAHRGQGLRDQLRAAHDEARRREATAALPVPKGVGPVGRFLDEVARARLAGGRQEAVGVVRRTVEAEAVPGLHAAAALGALGGDLGLESRLDRGDREAAKGLQPLVESILATTGKAYTEALGTYLHDSGSGERIQ